MAEGQEVKLSGSGGRGKGEIEIVKKKIRGTAGSPSNGRTRRGGNDQIHRDERDHD